VAFAVAVGAAETVNGFAFLAYVFGGVAFFCFIRLFEKSSGYLYGIIVK